MSLSARGTLIYHLQELSQEYTVCALLFILLPMRPHETLTSFLVETVSS